MAPLTPFPETISISFMPFPGEPPLIAYFALPGACSMKVPRIPRRTNTAFRRVRRWSIAIYTGDSPFTLSSPQGVSNPVLRARHVTDIPARFVPDPFMIRRGSRWYMFFEILDEKSRRGKIAYAESDNLLIWTYKSVALEVTFHLSYPYLFVCDDQVYMVPETADASAIRLYRAVQFPVRWKFASDLVVGRHYYDRLSFIIETHGVALHRPGSQTQPQSVSVQLQSSRRAAERASEESDCQLQSTLGQTGGPRIECEGRPFRLCSRRFSMVRPAGLGTGGCQADVDGLLGAAGYGRASSAEAVQVELARNASHRSTPS
jgi:hypothetical protein